MKHLPVPETVTDILKSCSRFALISHIDPDGDCIGSSLAMGRFLTRIGKEVKFYNQGPFGRREILEFQPEFSQRFSEEDIAQRDSTAVIILDCSTIDRIGDLAEDIEGMTIVVIDHHSTGKEFGSARFINVSAPATSLLVLQVIEAMGEKPTLEESEFIFFAFTTDTGFFRHLGEQSQVSFRFVAQLVEAGVSPRKIYDRITGGVSLESRQQLGLMLQRAQKVFNGRGIYVWETFEDIQKFGRENRDSDTLYQQLLSIEGIELLIVLREEQPGTTTCSLRSSHDIDVGELAAKMGGGGHARAAGFSVEGDIESTFEELSGHIRQIFPG